MGRTSEMPSSQELEITGLVRLAIEGDVEAYGKIYDICLERIYRYVFNQIGNTMQAEDVTEEVFIKAFKAIRSCRGKEQTFIPWLYRIAHNYLIDTYRKGHKEILVEQIELTSDIDPEKELENKFEHMAILEAIKSLPEMQKQVILLKYMDDNNNEAIGHILGKRQGAVRALQMRALERLRKILSSRVERYVI
ncbi:MAG: sigma-70 family RNA polymerase sigma factor [Dehalococcoidales bacterium]|nr:sigma-70 family RNA polymerase sigma factor [Dehalococcoidales bacterium]